MKRRIFTWLVMFIAAFFVFTNKDFQNMAYSSIVMVKQQITKSFSSIETQPSAVDYQGNIDTNKAAAASDSTTTVTGNTLQGMRLSSNSYYYHFAKGMPKRAKQVFEKAIKIYNQTGYVRLIAGSGKETQNQIRFSVYKKENASAAFGTIQLGEGGPEIIQRTGWQSYTANHGSARLNVEYSQALRPSVAIHELGHAVGLAHSDNPNSVMYPLDQGKEILTKADLAGLKAIYSENALNK